VLKNTAGLDVVDDGVMPSVGVRGVTGGLRASTRIIKVMINGVAVKTSPSIGVAVYPDHGTSQDRLYKSADLALYEAKRMGGNNWCWYRTRMAGGNGGTSSSSGSSSNEVLSRRPG